MREEFSQKVIDRNKELEKELEEEKLKNQYVSSDEEEEDLADTAEGADEAEADGAAVEPDADENQGTQTTDQPGDADTHASGMGDAASVAAEPQAAKVTSADKANVKTSRKPKTPPSREPCLHCGQSAGDGHAPRGRIKKSEALILEAERAVQTDEVDLWVRNHDFTQVRCF